MVDNASLLIALVTLVDVIPLPCPMLLPAAVYSDRLVLKALVIMLVRHLSTVHAPLAVLEQPTLEMRHLRAWLTEDGHYPSRRTFERRLHALPAQIACLSRYLVEHLQPFAFCGRAAALEAPSCIRLLNGRTKARFLMLNCGERRRQIINKEAASWGNSLVEWILFVDSMGGQ